MMESCVLAQPLLLHALFLLLFPYPIFVHLHVEDNELVAFAFFYFTLPTRTFFQGFSSFSGTFLF